MSEYNTVFRELQYEVWKVSFLDAFLNAAIAFFVSNIVFTLIHERYIYSLIPALIVFVWSFITKVRKYTLRRIEEGNPEVAEILRTAHDNSSKDSLMVHALFLELMEKMETVTAGIFIKPEKSLLKIVAIAVLAFIPVLITSYTPYLVFNNPLIGLTANAQNALAGTPLAPAASIDEAGNRDIYGDRDVINLGNEKLDITATSAPGGVDFTKTEDAQGKQFQYNDYPGDIQAEQTQAGTGGKAAESGLINDYSCKTKGTCNP
jgi:hypothetical protein